MKNSVFISSILALGTIAIVAGDASALTLRTGSTTCSTRDLTFGGNNALACEGAYDGNDSNSDLSGVFGQSTWSEWAKVNSPGTQNKGLTLTGGGNKNGTYTLSGLSIGEHYMIALKGGPTFSLYDLGEVTTSSLSGDWFTDGILTGNKKNLQAPGLSHLTVYTVPGSNNEDNPQDVPEPLTILGTTIALGFGGLFKNRKNID